VGGEYRTDLLIMKFSPLRCYLVPLRPKYSPHGTHTQYTKCRLCNASWGWASKALNM
jgi:hypothetical protein